MDRKARVAAWTVMPAGSLASVRTRTGFAWRPVLLLLLLLLLRVLLLLLVLLLLAHSYH